MEKPLDINLQTKVAEMLSHYPQLEDVLLELSPSFAKLKNPILRKTIARVATLKQISEIAGLNPGEMISTLRKGANLCPVDINTKESDNFTPQPEWVDENLVTETFDVCSIINEGKSPMAKIIDKSQSLKSAQILKIITPFVPFPIIDILKAKEYKCWSKSENNLIETYIIKNKDMTIKQILKDLESAKRPVAKILQSGTNFKVIAIGFTKNMVLDDHKTDIPAKLVVLEGKVVYKEGQKMIMLSQYEETPIPAGIIHSVTALEDSICLVIKG